MRPLVDTIREVGTIHLMEAAQNTQQAAR